MKKRILVVDDFATIQNFVRSTLQDKGYETLGASNGDEAYRILIEEKEIHLILADYYMPLGTGYDLLVQVKANPTTSSIPVIFLTTELDNEKVVNARKLGLFAWIKKPYRAEVMFDMIAKALNTNA